MYVPDPFSDENFDPAPDADLKIPFLFPFPLAKELDVDDDLVGEFVALPNGFVFFERDDLDDDPTDDEPLANLLDGGNFLLPPSPALPLPMPLP